VIGLLVQGHGQMALTADGAKPRNVGSRLAPPLT
jgi:hypothetical protein